MSGRSGIPQSHAGLTETAAAWLAALDAGSADVAAFEAWRDADIRHAVAFAEVAGTWRDLDTLRIAAGDQSRTVAAPVGEPLVDERPHRRRILRAAASVVAVAAMGGGFAYRAAARDMATTDVGERKTIAPMSGVAIDLNTDSRVHWRNGARKRVWLERGEIMLRLGPGCLLDLATPAGDFALDPGAYNARMRGAACELAVLAGRVSDGAATRIGAGEVAVVTGGAIDARSRDEADLRRATAWRHGTLILNGESLDYALAEINRYLPNKIVIGDPALSRVRLGGTFATTRPDEFLRALHDAFGVRATAGANGGIVLTHA